MQELISKFSLGGLIISIITLLIKINPVTLLTASELELKIITKEKRFSHNVVHYLIKVIFTSLILTAPTLYFMQQKYRPWIIYLLGTIISVGTIVIMYYTLRNIKVYDLIKEKASWKKIITFLVSVGYVVACFLLLPYLLGTKINEGGVINEVSFKYFLVVCTIIFIFNIFFAITTYIPFYNMYFLPFYAERKEKRFYIEIDNYKWFLLHSIDGENYLLGNKYYYDGCTEFTFISKKELLAERLKVDIERKI